MTNTELARKAIALLTDGTPLSREQAETKPVMTAPVALPSDPKRPTWLTAWRGIVDLVHGVTLEDPRLPHIMAALQLCDAAFEADDWAAFEQATKAVRQALKGRT